MQLALSAQQRGVHVHYLNIGNPRLELPDQIAQALHRLAGSVTSIPYPPSRGQPALLESWKAYLAAAGIPVRFQTEDLLVTAGAREGIMVTAFTLFDEGDEYILFEPFYPPYLSVESLTGAKPVAVALDTKNGYHLPDKQQIVEKITPKTKAIFFTNPSNPTGTVFTRQEIELLLEIAEEYGLYIISDEAYRGLVFDGVQGLSVLQVASSSQLDHVIVVDSLSKRLNVCGARLGLVLSKNGAFMQAAARFIENSPQAAYIEQEMVTDMLSDSLGYLAHLQAAFQRKRDIFLTTFAQEMGTTYSVPEGAFYVMLQLPIDNDVRFVEWMLRDFSENGETVMVAPGSGFYLDATKGQHEVRVAFVLSDEDLEKAARLLAHGVKAYG